MKKIWRQEWRKDGMRLGLLLHHKREKKQVKMTIVKLKSLQLQLNRKTMRMEPAGQIQKIQK